MTDIIGGPKSISGVPICAYACKVHLKHSDHAVAPLDIYPESKGCRGFTSMDFVSVKPEDSNAAQVLYLYWMLSKMAHLVAVLGTLMKKVQRSCSMIAKFANTFCVWQLSMISLLASLDILISHMC